MPQVSRRPLRCVPYLRLDGVRPSSSVIARLRQELAAEACAVGDLRAARCEIIETVSAARDEGSGYYEIAMAIVPATGDVAATMRRREHVAGNLRARMHEARCRRS